MQSSGWIYLSFADGNLAKGEQFLGACIVRGNDVMEGAIEAHRLKINPGGEVLGVPIPADIDEFELHMKYANRLLSKDDLKSLGFVPVKATTGEEV